MRLLPGQARGTVTMTTTIKIQSVNKKKGTVELLITGLGLQVENLPMDAVESGPHNDDLLTLRAGDSLQLPRQLDIHYRP